VGQDSVADPDPCAFGGVDAGAVPAITAFQGADPSFATSPPFDVSPERSLSFLGLSGFAWSASAGNHDLADTEVVEGVVDCLFAVAAVSGQRPRWPSGPFRDAFDCRCQAGRIGGVAGLDVVVEHDPVVVVADLRFMTELDRLTEPALRDRPGVGVVQG
jgi:hypothetical protein